MQITNRYSFTWPSSKVFDQLDFALGGWQFQAWREGGMRAAPLDASEWMHFKAHSPFADDAEAEAALVAWAAELIPNFSLAE